MAWNYNRKNKKGSSFSWVLFLVFLLILFPIFISNSTNSNNGKLEGNLLEEIKIIGDINSEILVEKIYFDSFIKFDYIDSLKEKTQIKFTARLSTLWGVVLDFLLLEKRDDCIIQKNDVDFVFDYKNKITKKGCKIDLKPEDIQTTFKEKFKSHLLGDYNFILRVPAVYQKRELIDNWNNDELLKKIHNQIDIEKKTYKYNFSDSDTHKFEIKFQKKREEKDFIITKKEMVYSYDLHVHEYIKIINNLDNINKNISIGENPETKNFGFEIKEDEEKEMILVTIYEKNHGLDVISYGIIPKGNEVISENLVKYNQIKKESVSFNEDLKEIKRNRLDLGRFSLPTNTKNQYQKNIWDLTEKIVYGKWNSNVDSTFKFYKSQDKFEKFKKTKEEKNNFETTEMLNELMPIFEKIKKEFEKLLSKKPTS
jgi:hypothetical protein